MDRIEKILRKLSKKDLKRIDIVLEKIANGVIDKLEIKKISGARRAFKVRVGRIKIMYEIDSAGCINIKAVRFRNEKTYRDF